MPIYNFSAGPAVLPQPVITQIQAELPSFRDSGMSILEISHRSDLFAQVLQDAEQDLRDLMAIPDNSSCASKIKLLLIILIVPQPFLII
ncbi:hypothetical protein WP50_36005 [Lactiplantibacillus plantarum]|nr:hypothetical protein WP50_36005 [Lactiplantibacillus plantarum]